MGYEPACAVEIILTVIVTENVFPASRSTSVSEKVTSAPVGSPDTEAVKSKSIVPELSKSKLTSTA